MHSGEVMTEPTTTPTAAAPGAVPDIKRPRGLISEWVWWGVALLGLGAFAGTAYYIKAHRVPDAKPQTIITSSEIPDDFFKSTEKPLPKEPEPAPEPPKTAAAPKPVPVTPQKVSAADLFTAQPVPVAPPAPPPPDPVEIFNESRRQSGGTAKVAKAGRVDEASDWIKTEDDFEDEKKTVASFPVDLSRVVTADRFIAAILVNAINSELPGKVVCVIEENVYGAHGREVLIPGGSRCIGRYKALGKPGDERINIIWERIITPDGINIHVGDAEMSDAMGRSGLTGDVDNRFMDRYGMALLVSTLSAATAYQIPVTNQGQQVVVQAYGSNIASLSSQILEKNINLKPKITLDAGQRILINPQRDIWFKKPERKDMMAVALDTAPQRSKGGKTR